MDLSIEFTIENEEGVETTHKLPARYEVCSKCEGHGTHLNPSIGNHAYGHEEFNAAFDNEGREQYFTRGGIYDVGCETCQGQRVVAVLNRKACTTAELIKVLALYDEYERCRREADDLAENEYRMQALMMGCEP